jgi:hypothetical protein
VAIFMRASKWLIECVDACALRSYPPLDALEPLLTSHQFKMDEDSADKVKSQPRRLNLINLPSCLWPVQFETFG